MDGIELPAELDGAEGVKVGYVQLRDGSTVVVARQGGSAWVRLPNRRLASLQPDEYKLERFVERVYDYFSVVDNMEIPWGADAVYYHELVSLVENVQADYERFQRNDPDAAAAHGIAPLKSGILAALMAILDLGTGVYDDVRAQAGWELHVETGHVRRAHAFLHLAHTIPDSLSQSLPTPALQSQQSKPVKRAGPCNAACPAGETS